MTSSDDADREARAAIIREMLDSKPFSGMYPSEFMRDLCLLWIDGEITFEEAERRFLKHREKK
ncbi:MAG: hypothetical protein QOJ15_2388 [Bradyrhizobium sp.]|jgi:hypothetical protein|nr:hypothetical protein [Bradyrhizobium sp.]